ncbi:formimidoylglutamase [Aquimarina intermedia]|uniref:Formimidoylglutamase n=1 Tax=Aquimarina intermedia TaxID=350814 RepID=A0A5S5C6S2_9FLAO|nr:formimidoylglutamase [Aquimarina intermedia]TYP75115.1 formiminoglutamase [Aquimarina intermedia]
MTEKIATSFSNYLQSDASIYSGRRSREQQYLHEKIHCLDLRKDIVLETPKEIKKYALAGYLCDEGVRRNLGRVGAANGSQVVRKVFGSMANHLQENTHLLDIGSIRCTNQNLEQAQDEMATLIFQLHKHNIFPIIIGGGHDLSFAHFRGIKECYPDKKIGIINFDAHFDLRNLQTVGNSGTPFNQIAKRFKTIDYLCLGINRAANIPQLFQIATELEVQYIEDYEFTIYNYEAIKRMLDRFINSVDYVYVTIDMDGFSAAYAPGVSAPSAIGFSVDIVLRVLKDICVSKKLISADIVEFNPLFDIDNRTAKLVSQLAYFIISQSEKA